MTGSKGALGSEAAPASPGPAPAGTAGKPAIADRPLVQHLCDRARENGRQPAFRAKGMGIWHEVTWSEHRATVEEVALGLQALDVGRGDRVAVLAPNRPEWLSIDLAVQSLGAATVGLYLTTTDAELTQLLAQTTPKVLVAAGPADVERLVASGHAGVDAVVVLDPPGAGELAAGDAGERQVIPFAELLQRGAAARAADASAWERAVAQTSADDVVAICLTPGTTGAPKPVALTGRDVALGASACLERVGAPGPRDRTVVRLPLAHLCERQVAVYATLLYGCVAHLPEDHATVGEATQEAQPTILVGLPGDWTAAAGQVDVGVSDSGRLARATWRAAMALRRRVQQANWQGRRAAPHVRLGAWLGYWAVCRPVLAKFGYGQLRAAITVNEPLPTATAERWGAWGVALHEAYTLVEGGGFVAVQARPGGPLTLVAGTEARLAEDGELLLRRSAPGSASATAAADAAGSVRTVDDAGWSGTGDLAATEADGGIRVVGRLADLLDLDGRAVMPTAIEQRLCRSPFLRHAVVSPIGANRLGALVQPDAQAVRAWARRRGLGLTGYGPLIGTEDVQALVAGEIDAVNTSLASEGLPQVAAHRLLPQPLDADAGEGLTAVRTVRRAAVTRQWAQLLQDMAGPVLSTTPEGAR